MMYLAVDMGVSQFSVVAKQPRQGRLCAQLVPHVVLHQVNVLSKPLLILAVIYEKTEIRLDQSVRRGAGRGERSRDEGEGYY